MTESEKGKLGCIGEKAWAPSLLDGEQIWTCPKRAYCDHARELDPIIERWVYAQRGQFPEPGQWLDQPAQLVACFRIIDAALTDAEGVIQRHRKAAAEAAQRQASQPAAPERKQHAHPAVRKTS